MTDARPPRHDPTPKPGLVIWLVAVVFAGFLLGRLGERPWELGFIGLS